MLAITLNRVVIALVSGFIVLLTLSFLIKDYVPADAKIERLAEEGDVDAQIQLGDRLDGQNAHAQAVSWYLKAAKQGSATAQRRLGLHYLAGRGVPRDIERAHYWHAKAAEQGGAEDQFWLGSFWEETGNNREAAAWYRKAAEQGHSLSQHHLGILLNPLELKRPMQKNAIEAYAWLNLAAMDPTVDFARAPRDRLERAMEPAEVRKAQELSRKLHKEIEQRKTANGK